MFCFGRLGLIFMSSVSRVATIATIATFATFATFATIDKLNNGLHGLYGFIWNNEPLARRSQPLARRSQLHELHEFFDCEIFKTQGFNGFNGLIVIFKLIPPELKSVSSVQSVVFYLSPTSCLSEASTLKLRYLRSTEANGFTKQHIYCFVSAAYAPKG